MQERANTLSCSMLKIREGKIILFILLEQEPNAIVFSWNDLRMSHSDNIHSYDSRSIIDGKHKHIALETIFGQQGKDTSTHIRSFRACSRVNCIFTHFFQL